MKIKLPIGYLFNINAKSLLKKYVILFNLRHQKLIKYNVLVFYKYLFS